MKNVKVRLKASVRLAKSQALTSKEGILVSVMISCVSLTYIKITLAERPREGLPKSGRLAVGMSVGNYFS